MLPNPYTPAATPPALPGRDLHLSAASQTLSPLRTGLPAPVPLIFYGVRGAGKTSVLRAIRRSASESGLVTAWTAGAKRQPLLDSVAISIATALEDFDVVPRDTGSIESLGVEVGFGPVRFAVGGRKAPAQSDATRGKWDVGSVERMFRAATRLCTKSGSDGLVLVIDELHTASRADLAVLFNATQNIADTDDVHPRPFALLGAGLPSLLGAITASATFGERTRFIPTGNLSEQDTQKAIVDPASDNGVTYDQAAIDTLTTASGGYTYFIQLFAFHTWQVASPTHGSVISAADARAGLAAAQVDIDHLFTARLDAATQRERMFIRAMARLGGDEPVSRSAVAAELGVPVTSTSEVRNSLLNKAVVTSPQRGLLQFTIPGFAEFVLSDDE